MNSARLRLVVGLCAAMFVGAAIWWLFIAETSTRPILHPETGYDVPDVTDVKSMQLINYRGHTCDVRGGYWHRILERLTPSEKEPDELVISMTSIGRIKIALVSGQSVVIELFDTGPNLWFCVREPKPDIYYYGESLSALEDALRAACDDSHRADSTDPKRTP